MVGKTSTTMTICNLFQGIRDSLGLGKKTGERPTDLLGGPGTLGKRFRGRELRHGENIAVTQSKDICGRAGREKLREGEEGRSQKKHRGTNRTAFPRRENNAMPSCTG